MKIFVAGGDASVTEGALFLVLDAIREKHKITLVSYSKKCPAASIVDRWAWSRNVLYGNLMAQSPEVFWDMVDSVVALPGAPDNLLSSAKAFNKPVWAPFREQDHAG